MLFLSHDLVAEIFGLLQVLVRLCDLIELLKALVGVWSVGFHNWLGYLAADMYIFALFFGLLSVFSALFINFMFCKIICFF